MPSHTLSLGVRFLNGFKIKRLLWFLLFAILFCSCEPSETGGLSVCVVDGWEDRPIEGARVVIAETGAVCMTDAAGRTEKFTVPILRDRHFANILPQEWGTVTVLVYADGYYACALYQVRVDEGRVREDLSVRLFPGDGTMDGMPFLLVESPDSEWTAELLRRYDP